jgi:nitrogen regulatory protein PII-like uncharacterized protein
VHQLCSVRLDLVSISSDIALNSIWPDASQIGDFLDSWLWEAPTHWHIFDVTTPVEEVLKALNDVIPEQILSCTSVALDRFVSINLSFVIILS